LWAISDSFLLLKENKVFLCELFFAPMVAYTNINTDQKHGNQGSGYSHQQYSRRPSFKAYRQALLSDPPCNSQWFSTTQYILEHYLKNIKLKDHSDDPTEVLVTDSLACSCQNW